MLLGHDHAGVQPADGGCDATAGARPGPVTRLDLAHQLHIFICCYPPGDSDHNLSKLHLPSTGPVQPLLTGDLSPAPYFSRSPPTWTSQEWEGNSRPRQPPSTSRRSPELTCTRSARVAHGGPVKRHSPAPPHRRTKKHPGQPRGCYRKPPWPATGGGQAACCSTCLSRLGPLRGRRGFPGGFMGVGSVFVWEPNHECLHCYPCAAEVAWR